MKLLRSRKSSASAPTAQPAGPDHVQGGDYDQGSAYGGYHQEPQLQTPVASIDTEHNDMIYDIQLDYYGKRLATCSGDRTFRVYDVSNATSAPEAQPTKAKSKNDGTEENPGYVLQHIVQLPEDSVAPVHRIAWAHPKYGSVVAMACQDGRVYVYREELLPNGSQTHWQQKYVHTFHQQSVLSIAWAPYEYGLCLASASADGQVSFLTRMKEGWITTSYFLNSMDGAACSSVSWAPYNSLGSQGAQGPIQRVVTGSINTAVTIWEFSSESNQWVIVGQPLYGHNDWVRDVAWAPNVGVPANIIASGSDDHTVRVWSQDELGGEWKAHTVHTFKSPVYRISWSLTGTVLSVASGDDEITFWKQRSATEWVQISSMNEQGAHVIY
ncbi:hypothetical protein Poli38472_000693 [Pythium oligandrum]|uniref:Uncharacterized protein n=1 Tax=Pythium oligandrum TaxID=41045 RepID=A0A8K1CC68_PYTOL|nr:hypothetical protein Poli38472_000693 [Pythium oligandrum]|eukprot:TMW60651.1 hypothetical protein Poli38472_000693 [Pythium oligandrum]